MEHKRLGSSDLFVSEIGLGCMSLTRGSAAAEILERAVDLGVTFFDTADLYDHGENERLVGRVLKPFRDQVVIATKVGNRWREDGSGWDWDPSKAYIKNAVHRSLQRLGLDYIDLYQLHGGTIADPMDETIEAFEELRREGSIRYYGISSIRPNVIREYARRSDIVSVMMQYSLLDRRPEEEILEFLRQRGIGVIVRGPVAKGLLAGKPPQEYLEHSSEEVARAQQQLGTLVGPGRTMAQSALRFTLAHPAVTTVIPGASSRAQLEENVGAVESPALTLEEVAALQREVAAGVYLQHR